MKAHGAKSQRALCMQSPFASPAATTAFAAGRSIGTAKADARQGVVLHRKPTLHKKEITP